jgi:hypothetical protein
MKNAPWTSDDAPEMGRRGGSETGRQRRRTSMLSTIGSVEAEARRVLENSGSRLKPEDFKTIEYLLANVYIAGWKRGYQAGWRKERAFVEQARKRDAAA